MDLEQLTRAIASLPKTAPIGRVEHISGNLIKISGLPVGICVGDRVEVGAADNGLAGEVISLSRTTASALVEGATDGVQIGTMCRLNARRTFAPSDGWIGRVVDPDGRPLDGRPLLPGPQTVSLRASPPPPHTRRGMGNRLETGLAVTNTFLPIVRGQRVGLFAGSGVGKSTLLANLARNVDADVIVIALVGERGREVRHFTEDVLGPEGMARTVVVAATSDRAPQTRRQCAWSATAVAEHFRDQGLHVLLLCDSVTRFCEAHRELASAAGEMSNLRGFPASTTGVIAGLCERAGPGAGLQGDITAIYTVLVAGSDMEEPVADMLRGVLDGHVVLDREIAEKGRFPAVDVLRSVSRSLPDAATRVENDHLQRARRLLASYDRAELMIQTGLYVAGSDPEVDAAIAAHSELESFLAVQDRRGVAGHFAALSKIIATAEAAKIPNV